MNNKLKELQKEIIAFRDERDWAQFHKIKDLLLALNIEVSELQDEFLWKNENEINQVKKENIEDEIADIFIYLNYICHEFGIDLENSVRNKIEKNGKKYPIEKSRGSHKKYRDL